MSRHCLAIRWGAFGDLLYALPTLEKLKAEYGYLHLETGSRGAVLFKHSPIFDRISVFDVMNYKVTDHLKLAEIRWNSLDQAFKWDKVVNFWRCLEVECIAEEWQESFFWPRERRRAEFRKRNFYDTHLVKAGYQPGLDNCGTFYFDDATMFWMDHFRRKHKDDFIVAISLCGSTGQKVPFHMEQLAEEISLEIPEAVFILLGDKDAEQLQFSLGRKNVMQTAGKYGYLQAMAVTQLADYVIGPETSLLVAAGLFGTPKTMICTSCGVEQATLYHKNDFSIQSDAPCSPCYRAIYNYLGQASQRFCNLEMSWLGEVPVCNTQYDFQDIIEGVKFAYKVRGLRKEVDRNEGPGFTTLPCLRSLSIQEVRGDEEVRPGILPEVRDIRENPPGSCDQRLQVVPGGKIPPG